MTSAINNPKSVPVAVVTGGNKGIGFEIVKGLCEKIDGVVYLTARDAGRGQAAVSNLQKLGLDPKFHQLDINDEGSVTKLRHFLTQTHGGLDLLINNAAIAFSKDDSTPFAKQAEITIGVNYFSTLKVCEILFPILRNNAKVVNLSSLLGHLSLIPSDKLKQKFKAPSLTIDALNELMNQFIRDAQNNKVLENGWPENNYVVSKVGISALTVVQQRNFNSETPNRGISVTAVHPGYVDTDMTNHLGPLTPKEGAKAPLFVALGKDDLKGKYVWYDCRVVPWDNEAFPKDDPKQS